MRKIGRYRRQKQKKILIIGSLSLLLFLCVGYAAFSTNLSITAKGNIKEKSRVIQSWSIKDQTDFHSDFYKQSIVSATFLDNADVPNNATESWNVSEETTHGGVMAWVVPNNEDSTKYDLYIGARGGVIANEDSSDLFSEFINIVSINFNDNFDTSNATSMRQMFYHCSDLEKIDLSNFDTSRVTNMQDFISGGNKLTSLDLTSFNTSNVTTMYHMFSTFYRETQTSQSSTLKEILFSPTFDTSKVVNMDDMFAGLTELETVDLSNFNTSNVTTMYHMFYNCENITIINLCSFDTVNVTNMIGMFYGTSNLSVIYVGIGWDTSNASTSQIFSGSAISQVTTGQC